MTQYDVVLVPTDWSPPAERGVDHGLELAANNAADVHFVYVLDRTRYGDTPAISSYELALEEAEDQAIERLEELADRARDRGLTADVHCRRGTPHEEIVGLAETIDADLVVMGKHGEGQAETPHIGSVADRVLRTTERPVFTV
ncbi:universal stress protein [Natribaculum luteum]|uniref:Universal stress protein n=1 Tax=Natribaculum luteum TaxID=1586232 RepID=A0ABD5NZ57_9EURY|nr:universal stress protein [Natribaculum luteum]